MGKQSGFSRHVRFSHDYGMAKADKKLPLVEANMTKRAMSHSHLELRRDLIPSPFWLTASGRKTTPPEENQLTDGPFL